MAVAAREPKYGYCPDCGTAIHNRGAHAEACPGIVRAQAAKREKILRSRPRRREWTGWYQVSGLCGCPPRRDGGRCAHGNPYVPTFKAVS